jgi:hypothetical protein
VPRSGAQRSAIRRGVGWLRWPIHGSVASASYWCVMTCECPSSLRKAAYDPGSNSKGHNHPRHVDFANDGLLRPYAFLTTPAGNSGSSRRCRCRIGVASFMRIPHFRGDTIFQTGSNAEIRPGHCAHILAECSIKTVRANESGRAFRTLGYLRYAHERCAIATLQPYSGLLNGIRTIPPPSLERLSSGLL